MSRFHRRGLVRSGHFNNSCNRRPLSHSQDSKPRPPVRAQPDHWSNFSSRRRAASHQARHRPRAVCRRPCSRTFRRLSFRVGPIILRLAAVVEVMVRDAAEAAVMAAREDDDRCVAVYNR